MTPDAKPRRWLLPLAIVLLVLLAGGAIWKFWPRPLPPRPPLATVSFANGTRIELLDVAVGTTLDDGFDTGAGAAPSFGFFPSMGTGTHSSRSFPHSAEFHHREAKGDPFMHGVKITMPRPALMLLVRGFDELGKPGRLAWEAEARGKSTGQNLLSRVEIWNGDALGWQPIEGPGQPMPTDPRAFCTAVAYPRQAEKLRLRFVQAGQPPVELEIANPQPVVATPWKAADALPAEKSAGETGVRLTVPRWQKDERGRWAALLVADATAPPWHFRVSLLGVEDAFGNFSDLFSQVALPPGNGAWKARYMVSRGPKFPTPLRDAVLFAEGEFAGVGQPVTLALAPAFAAPLTTSTIAAEAHPADPLNETFGGTMRLRITARLTGTGTPPASATDLGRDLQVYVEDRLIEGYAQSGGGGSSSNGAKYEMHSEIDWLGTLPPGSKFKLAIPKPVPPVNVEFLFDPPPLPTPGKLKKER